MYLPEEAGGIVMNLNPPRRNRFELPGRLDDLLRTLFIEIPLGTHAADDTPPTHGDIAVLVGIQLLF